MTNGTNLSPLFIKPQNGKIIELVLLVYFHQKEVDFHSTILKLAQKH